jgi:hypothetical protein
MVIIAVFPMTGQPRSFERHSMMTTAHRRIALLTGAAAIAEPRLAPIRLLLKMERLERVLLDPERILVFVP